MHVDRNSHKLKVKEKRFGWALSKMGVASLVTEFDFLHGGAHAGKLKVILMIFIRVGVVKNGHDHLIY